METKKPTVENKKACIKAGATCLVTAAMFFTYAVYFIVLAARLGVAPPDTDNVGDYAAAYIILYLFQRMAFLGLGTFAFILVLLGGLQTASAVGQFRCLTPTKIKRSLDAGCVISIIVAVFAFLPFVLGPIRMIVHGPEKEWASFVFCGFIPMAATVPNIVFNRLAAKKIKPELPAPVRQGLNKM